MTSPYTLTTPPGFQAFGCRACGACCRRHVAVAVTERERANILALPWNGALPEPTSSIFIARPGGYRLAQRTDGACIFLNEQGRCQIHVLFGTAAKPLPCQMYPFRFVALGSQLRVDIQFDCPMVAKNAGRPIPSYRPLLLRLAKTAFPLGGKLNKPPRFAYRQPAWGQLCRITETFEGLLTVARLPFTRRVLACTALMQFLPTRHLLTHQGRKLSNILELEAQHITTQLQNTVLTPVAPSLTTRAAFRQLLHCYGCHASQHNISPTLDFDLVDQYDVTIEQQALEILERYLHLKLSSMSFCGKTFYQRDFLSGLNALLLTFPLICWFARAISLTQQLPVINQASMAMAIQLVDHHHGVSPQLNSLGCQTWMRYLSNPRRLRTLITWYGGDEGVRS